MEAGKQPHADGSKGERVVPPGERLRMVGPSSRRPDVPTGEISSVADTVDQIIKDAIRRGASDVHVEPTDTTVVVRFRLDGLLKTAFERPRGIHEGLVSRIKVMAGMDIAEKRLPQDGRIRVATGGDDSVDLRVSTLRTVLGEKVVIRLLDHRKGVPPLDALGLSAVALEHVRRFLRRPHGMILVVGPTGSGKTTTLGSALMELRSERTNIVTIEDPVEYRLRGINQTQVNEKIGLTFAGSLRAILRQDPDVVLVGEIRDLETARIAIQAAQTGHLVLSTLHTDDAPSSVVRLADIGIEPFATTAALIGVVAQRLVRRLCQRCRTPDAPPTKHLRAIGVPPPHEGATFFRAVGCDDCHGTGFKGRVGIYEVMPISQELRRIIVAKDGGAALRAAAEAAGMSSLVEDGASKVKAGVTTAEEILRVAGESWEDTEGDTALRVPTPGLRATG
jgi:type II secretory ATPase GspE/PulE/Tfp pilus assembly ATPase PilB-like protein